MNRTWNNVCVTDHSRNNRSLPRTRYDIKINILKLFRSKTT